MAQTAKQYQHLPEIQQEQVVQTRTAVKARKRFLSPFEFKMVLVLSVVLFFMLFNIIRVQEQLFHINRENISLQKQVEAQVKENDELASQVKVESSSDRIYEKAAELGLKLNEKNVKAVSPNEGQ